MLLALNSTTTVQWDELQTKVSGVCCYFLSVF